MKAAPENPAVQAPLALVTGGGSGIGRELCKLFNRDGYRLVIVSLLEDELASVKAELLAERPDADVLTIQQDLSLPDAGEKLYASIRRRKIAVDVLVNNAGYGLWGDHFDIPFERIKSMLMLNMVTLTTLATKFGAEMRERGSGGILNIGSTTSFQPLPYLAAYAATKHYVVAFSEALAEEMKGYGVTVTCVCPGTTATKFLETAGVQSSPTFGSVGYFADKAAMSPVDVARVAYEGLRAGQRKPIPGLSNWVHFLGSRLLPNRGMAWAMRQVYQVKGK
ncbi:MAG: SDR family oxidoreductase [Moraxellaceae bacterium]|nr:SDR family oxidoreductase [Moraxellaceae bacterium]